MKKILLLTIIMIVLAISGCSYTPTVTNLLEGNYYDWYDGTGYFSNGVHYRGITTIKFDGKIYVVQKPDDDNRSSFINSETWEILSDNVWIKYDVDNPDKSEAEISFECIAGEHIHEHSYYLIRSRDDPTSLALIPYEGKRLTSILGEKARPFAYFGRILEDE